MSDPDQTRHFMTVFSAARLGEAVKQVGVDYISVDQHRVETKWFRSGEDVDLVVWTDMAGTIIKQQLTFFGQVLEWNLVDGLKTGLIVEEETGQQESPASEMVRYDLVRPLDATVQQGVELLSSIACLSPQLRDGLVQNVVKPVRLRDWPAGKVMLNFGSSAESTNPRRSPSSWIVDALSRLKFWRPGRS